MNSETVTESRMIEVANLATSGDLNGPESLAALGQLSHWAELEKHGLLDIVEDVTGVEVVG